MELQQTSDSADGSRRRCHRQLPPSWRSGRIPPLGGSPPAAPAPRLLWLLQPWQELPWESRAGGGRVCIPAAAFPRVLCWGLRGHAWPLQVPALPGGCPVPQGAGEALGMPGSCWLGPESRAASASLPVPRPVPQHGFVGVEYISLDGACINFMWENPQRFQGNYRKSSLAQRGVLPIQSLIPTEKGGLGEAAPALRPCPLPAATHPSRPCRRDQRGVVRGPVSGRAPPLAQGDGTERRAVAELAVPIHVLRKGWKTSPRQANCLHFIHVLGTLVVWRN